MKKFLHPQAALLGLSLLLGACGHSAPVEERAALTRSEQAQCLLKSGYLQVGAGLDATGRLEVDAPAAAAAQGVCAGNTAFAYGSGLYDITGVVANTSGMGWESPTQVFSGLHQRQYARAFAIASPCNGKRVMFVDSDTGMIFGAVRLKVLELIAADPALSPFYGPDNLMLSATHTHEGPAGYSHYLAFNLFHFGYDEDTFQAIAQGIYQAVRLAQANLAAHPQTGSIKLAVGELLNTNINRSLPAFQLNSQSEREQFRNARGEVIDTDKRMVQLSLVRDNGSAVGLINWFGVHPTIIGENLKLVSSDMKGYAGLGFEKLMRTDYAAPAGQDNFVAAFAQADEGDSSPNLFIRERPYPDPTRGGGKDEYESAAISGTKHIAKALELYDQGKALRGPVDYRLMFVKMDEVTVTDPVVLASLQHPAELDAPVKRTCSPVLGPSFAAGAEDGPGPATEGLSCASSPELLAAAMADFQTLLNFNPDNPTGHILPLQLVSQAALCDLSKLPPVAGVDFSCQAEKPIALPVGPPVSAEPVILPLQIFRLGNLALVGIPWEVTTMSARRIRAQLLALLAPVGVDTVVLAGLVNDYVHYLPTREEYASQQYEGASDIFGPWTLAAVQQELRKLAISLRDAVAAPSGPAYVDGVPLLIRPPYVPSDVAGLGKDFGALLTDVPASARQGETVSAEFQAGHPRNDLKIQSSYAYVEQLQADGSWKVVVSDRSPELWFVWKPTLPSPLPIDPAVIGSSTAQAVWHIPANQPAGTYRLRHDGAAQTLLLPRQAYSGVSSAFTLGAPASACP
ncbi:neutral ceramidase [Solimonas aquatica]|uniref:Neutral ceramidase n=1 Tax=Solimonas aquatica TaxID=489703 RepID=A0A1H9D3E5_9GAMM|nr:neutral/alkaline non-lysosomal ceramidase N-terminal domain-containing protein [Solimonas aquatica]SEQ07318.1 neutral ceramidase [Solimonas aquatica]